MASPAGAADGYFRFPTLAGDQIVFTAEGDLWTAPINGGRAARLTTPPGGGNQRRCLARRQAPGLRRLL
ncbi:MAG: hypothetical protein WDN69_17440 [Aliidongia sp.]